DNDLGTVKGPDILSAALTTGVLRSFSSRTTPPNFITASTARSSTSSAKAGRAATSRAVSVWSRAHIRPTPELEDVAMSSPELLFDDPGLGCNTHGGGA